jgi:hypothetical protein
MTYRGFQGQSWRLALVILAGWWLASAVAVQAEPGLVAHYYGNLDFWYYAGTVPAPSLNLSLNLNNAAWPAQNWDATKGPLFARDQGDSVAVDGALQVDQPGAYRFFSEGNAAELHLNGLTVALDGTRPIPLAVGSVPLRLYIKSSHPLKDWNLACHVRWQGPGMAAPQDIPASLLSYTPEDQQQTDIFTPDIPLTDPEIHFFHRRDYQVTLPQDGFYEIAGHFPYVPQQIEIQLDGHFLYHHLGRGDIDPAGPSDYHFGFLNEARAVRYLPAGQHTITISGYSGTYVFDLGAINNFFATSRFGVSLVPDNDPQGTLSIYAPGRDDLVFRRREPLVVRVEQATQEATSYTMQVVRQRGDGTVVWSGKTQLPAQTPHATGEISYPCNQEGAFEYTITDDAGRVVDGPWALMVVDPTPLPPPAPAADLPDLHKVLVDSVDCTAAEDTDHQFRDNGTSKVVEGPAGAYRLVGTDPMTTKWYQPKSPPPGMIPLDKQAPGAVSYEAKDWFAYTLHVQHPGKPHMVVAYVPNDQPRLVSVWGLDQVTGNYNGAALEAGNAPASPPFSTIAFLMYPNGDAIDVTSICDELPGGGWRGHEPFQRAGAIAKIELYELPDGLPPMPRPASGFAPGKEFGWNGEQVNLGIEERMTPSLWKDNALIPGSLPYQRYFEGPYYDWLALSTAWERFGQLSRWRGDHLLIWPVSTYDFGQMGETAYSQRDDEAFTRNYRSRIVDPMRRDQVKMILLECQKYGVQFVADFEFMRWDDAVIMATDPEKRYTADGLFLTDLAGNKVTAPGAILNPAHPLSRQYLVHWVEEIAQRYGSYPAFQGINFRQSGWNSANSAYFFNDNCGYDDFTVGLFEQETGNNVPVDSTGTDRFKLRHDYLLANLKQPWLQWRCDKVNSLRQEMLAALRKYAPHARFYAWIDPKFWDLESGSGLDPEVQGNRDLGYGHVVKVTGPHIECGSNDPVDFANFDVRQPASLHLTMDNTWFLSGAGEYPGPFVAGAGATVRPYPYELEPLATALAAGDIQTVEYGGPWIIPPLDDGIRRWSQAWQALPDLHYSRFLNPDAGDQPLVCWQAVQGGSLTGYLVNVTAYRQQADLTFVGAPTAVTNLVTGEALGAGPTVTVDVDPFMVLPLAATGATGVEKIEHIGGQ